jgi:hypothetical protein
METALMLIVVAIGVALRDVWGYLFTNDPEVCGSRMWCAWVGALAFLHSGVGPPVHGHKHLCFLHMHWDAVDTLTDICTNDYSTFPVLVSAACHTSMPQAPVEIKPYISFYKRPMYGCQVVDMMQVILPVVFFSEIGDGLNCVCGGKYAVVGAHLVHPQSYSDS